MPAAIEKTVTRQMSSLPIAALGQGYDTFAGSARSTAVSGTTVPTGAVSKLRYKLCRGTSNFSEAINVSTTISAGLEFFDEISEKASFYQSLHLTETSVSIVLYASHSEGSEFTSVALTASPPTDRTTAAKFFAGYGDRYVARVETGGEFIAVYTFYAETFDAQINLVTKLNANGISEEGTIDASLAARLHLVYDSYNSRRKQALYLKGYTGKDAPRTIDEIVEFASAIFGQRADAPAILNYDPQGYENVPGFPREAWRTIEQNRTLFGSAFEGLAASRSKLALLQNKIAAILDIYDGYGVKADRADLAARKEDIDANIDALQTLVDKIDEDPTLPARAPDLHSLTWGTPSLNYSQIPLRWGGTGGGEFADVTFGDVLSGVRLTSLQLKAIR